MKNELEALIELDHPNIVKVFDLIEDDNNYYIVCELMEGGNLLEYLEARYK